MSYESQPELADALRAPPDGRSKVRHSLQFSVAALMSGMLFLAFGLAAVRWLGSVWLIPISLVGLSAASFALAVRSGSSWRMLKLDYWHGAIWLALAATASSLAVRGCLDYNAVAGTDKTPGHIVQISAAVLAGPLVGPIANPGAGERPQAFAWTAILFTIMLLAAGPFLLVQRTVPIAIALICWISFVAATILWFFGAMISLAFFLS
jgi:hypothetical protein